MASFFALIYFYIPTLLLVLIILLIAAPIGVFSVIKAIIKNKKRKMNK